MPEAPDSKPDHAELIEKLLTLPDAQQGAALLRRYELLDPDGLDALLDEADELLDSDPGKARRLAAACMGLADLADAPAAVPKANYVLAGAHDLDGDFERALELTRLAHDGYTELGMEFEALRTEVGRMGALLEMGLYDESLQLGESIRSKLVAAETSGMKGEEREKLEHLKALVHLNEGGCYEYMGSYDDAISAYAESERLFERIEMPVGISQVSNNLGLLLLETGKGREALKSFERAATLFRESGLVVSYCATLMNIGYVHLHLGDYLRSLEAFQSVEGMLSELDAAADKRRLSLGIAETYASLNLHSEALAAYDEIERSFTDDSLAHERALALWGAGSVHAARGEFGKAEQSLSQAAGLFEAAGNVPLLAGVMLERSHLYSSSGRGERALEVASESLGIVAKSGEWPLQHFFARLRMIDLLLPDVKSAEIHLLEARRLLDEMSLPQLRYRFAETSGRILRHQHREEEAKTQYEVAIREIEGLRGTVTVDAMRASFLEDKVSVYESLLELVLETSTDTDVLDGFRVAEQTKSRALADLMGRISSPVESRESEGQLSVLQEELNVVYNRILRREAGSEQSESLATTLQERAAELEGEIGRLRLRLDGSEIATSDPFESSAARETLPQRLASDVVLLAYHVLGDEVLAFVVSGGEVRVRRRVGSVSKVRALLRKLDSQWDRFRSGQTYSERQSAMLEKSTKRVLAALYDEVVRPVESLLQGAVEGLDGEVPKLAVVPHGPLHQSPFHAFFDGERYLLERFEISYAPSAAVFALCQERESRGLDRIVAVGVSDELIPAARDEAATVAGLFPESEVLLDEQATSEALEEAVPGSGALHLACHGMFRSDNPMFSALKLHGGWLLAHDAMGLDLRGAVVALSACESGRNVVVGGDEILGLTRAFLGARASTLLVSLWIVHDDTTSTLMRGFYERLISGVGPATALREAQLEMKEIKAHPYYWAPFIGVGKR